MAHLQSHDLQETQTNNGVEDSSMEACPAQKKLKSTQTTELLSALQKFQVDIREKDDEMASLLKMVPTRLNILAQKSNIYYSRSYLL